MWKKKFKEKKKMDTSKRDFGYLEDSGTGVKEIKLLP